ncbi:MAG: hypothetical protein L0H84_18690 [Pseudonocardia sp.]|nr:hypothetical protein [Pseudonocardia sp.]
MSDPVVPCAGCAARRDPGDPAALAWASERAGDRVTWLCPECARRHVRDIEARLDREWWA